MDELQISGKRFISSRRVAREHGYTSDYVGQLIRGGKLVGQKVGRAWYVEAGSLDAFLGTESVAVPAAATAAVEPVVQSVAPAPAPTPTPTPTPTPKPEPVVELSVVEEKPEEVQIKIKKEEPVETKNTEEVRHVPLHVATPLKVSGLRYVAEEEPTLPQISVRKQQVAATEPLAPRESAPDSRAHYSRGRALALAALAVGVFALSAFTFSAVSLELSVEEGSAATAVYSLKF